MKRIIIIVGIVLSVIYLTTLITGTTYIYKTLIYREVDYDDYKIFENRVIDNGTAQPWPQSKSPIELSQADKDYFSQWGTISVVGIRKDSVFLEHYFEDFNQSTIANSFSVAKSYIGMLIGIALKEGKIKSLDQKVGEFIPEYSQGDKSEITIKNLLTMSSGLDWTESYSSPFNVVTESYYGTDLNGLVFSLKMAKEPGTSFNYKGCDPQLLAMVLEKATGQHVSNYLSEKFWIPTGAENQALWSLDHKDGIEKAYCCINATALDFARIGYLYLHKGNWKGQQILDTSYVESAVAGNMIPDETGNPTEYYGYQWWTMQDIGKNMFYCRGLNGQYVLVVPEKEIILVRIGKLRDRGTTPHPADVMKLAAIADSL